jgi:pseudouridine kinase
VVRSPGGVGRNVAENLARLGSPVALVSVVGSDPDGDWLLDETAGAGVDVTPVLRGGQTGRYVAVLDVDGDLVAGVSDMAATDAITPEALDLDLLGSAALVVVDGNLPVPTIDAILSLGARVVIDPVSVAKAERISLLLSGKRPVFAITPNQDELAALGSVEELHERGVEVVWVRRGAAGSLLSAADRATELAAPGVVPVDVTGAGDAMLAAFCHRLLGGASLADAARYGHEAAALTVASPHTVRPDLRERMPR